jgi:hypothetical protein
MVALQSAEIKKSLPARAKQEFEKVRLLEESKGACLARNVLISPGSGLYREISPEMLRWTGIRRKVMIPKTTVVSDLIPAFPHFPVAWHGAAQFADPRTRSAGPQCPCDSWRGSVGRKQCDEAATINAVGENRGATPRRRPSSCLRRALKAGRQKLNINCNSIFRFAAPLEKGPLASAFECSNNDDVTVPIGIAGFTMFRTLRAVALNVRL